jgi:methyl-accepting chemotaxis protein
MSAFAEAVRGHFTERQRIRLYGTVFFLLATAVSASAAIIYYFNEAIANNALEAVTGSLQVGLVALMPYMISAIIAAITAISVKTILPFTRSIGPGRELVNRLQQMSDGDLSGKLRVGGNHQLREIVTELNIATQSVGSQVAQIKVINRRQWGVLCRIRLALEEGRPEEALRSVGEMERNWDKLAEIEDRLLT